MAFKLKSGNKVSFKSMGSSPAKQGEAFDRNDPKQTEALKKIRESKKTYPKSYTEKDVKFLKEQREDIVRREDLDEKGKAIWDAQRAKDKTKGEKSFDKFIDKKPSKKVKSPAKQGVTSDGVEIKSKKQISQENKTAKTSSRTNEVTEDRKILGVKVGKRKYTKAERKADKMANLKAKQKRATGLEEIGKGEKGFSWKEAGKSVLRGEGLLGNIASGMGKGRDKSAIIKDKITTVEEKGKRTKMVKASREKRKVSRKEARATRNAERKAKLAKNIDISAG